MKDSDHISGELAAMLPVMGEAMALAAQSLRQSTALASLLIEKKWITQQELDAAVASNPDPAKKLRDMLLGSTEKLD